jgi:subtilisin-like proprotein convertase family protein
MSSLKPMKNLYIFGVAILSSLAFFIATTSVVLASPQVTFNGNGVGPIPDSTSQFPNCQVPGAPLNITFNVTGLSANVQTVELTMTFNPRHTYAGDIVATLISPNGTRELDLFGYKNASSANPAGSFWSLKGPYTFTDTATQSWWTAAYEYDENSVWLKAGSYRTSQRGGTPNGGENTSLNAIFGGLTPTQANGTWTLRLNDGCAEDVGSVSTATLNITTTMPTAASVAVTGRVISANGRGIRNVLISLLDESGQQRTAVTSTFGYYRFADVPAGQSYTISAVGKRYSFTQPAQVLNLTGDTDDINFVADN